jgi:hypothetical protein
MMTERRKEKRTGILYSRVGELHLHDDSAKMSFAYFRRKPGTPPPPADPDLRKHEDKGDE